MRPSEPFPVSGLLLVLACSTMPPSTGSLQLSRVYPMDVAVGGFSYSNDEDNSDMSWENQFWLNQNMVGKGERIEPEQPLPQTTRSMLPDIVDSIKPAPDKDAGIDFERQNTDNVLGNDLRFSETSLSNSQILDSDRSSLHQSDHETDLMTTAHWPLSEDGQSQARLRILSSGLSQHSTKDGPRLINAFGSHPYASSGQPPGTNEGPIAVDSSRLESSLSSAGHFRIKSSSQAAGRSAGQSITPGPNYRGRPQAQENSSLSPVVVQRLASLWSPKPTIYIAGLFPCSQGLPAGAVGRGVLPAVNIAIEHVNKDTRRPRKYTLQMAFNDTRCDMAVATKAFFDKMADRKTTTAMLFGDVCYNVTGPMVQIAHQWGLVLLSFADTNPMLSDKDEYPNFFRTIPSDVDFNPARLALLRHFNWSLVATLFQDAKLGEGRHGYASNKFDSLVEKHRINVSIVESFADDPDAAIRNLKHQDVRVIVGNFDQNMARKVFCSARHHGMYGSKYQWIILGTYEPNWWTTTDESISCSPGELDETLNGYLATDVLPLSSGHDLTESGWTAAQYMELYDAARGTEFSKYHGYAYDGVWVVAKALDRLLEDDEGSGVSPDKFRGPKMARVLNETNFLGVTGRVQFRSGDRVGNMVILQMQDGSMVKVGEYHALTDTLNLSQGQPIQWKDGKVPVDRSIRVEELRHVSVPVYVGFVVVSAVGVTIAVLFLAVNIRYRNHRYIKMSSPNMNNLIIVGCILCYLSILLLGTDPDLDDRMFFSYWCRARSSTLALGFTLAFGAMFGKTWRVHAIFTNIKLNKKVIKDYKLMLLVLVLVLLDVIILVTWQLVDPFDKAVKKLSPEVYEDYELIPKIVYCYSNHMEIWLGALYAYKGLLLAFGCFLAWETRHVSIPALNDSKYIGMSVYNVVIMCVCGAAVSFIIQDRPTQSFVIIGLFIVFCTTITLCLVFLPKVIQLKMNPKGDEQRVRATLGKASHASNIRECSALRQKVKVLAEENRQLRGHLEEKANELENLLEQLGDDVIKEDLGLSSALLHKKVLQLQHLDGSPGKFSVKSCCNSEAEWVSTYSEVSGTTTLYNHEEASPSTLLLKNRLHNNCRPYSESIELGGLKFKSRECSLTLPAAAEEESDFDPFGGVYLGPSDSLSSNDDPSGDVCTGSSLAFVGRDSSEREMRVLESIHEKMPLMSGQVSSFKSGNLTSADSLLDNAVGAPGLVTSFGSVDTTNIGNRTERLAGKKETNGMFPSLHVMAEIYPDASYREIFASDDIVLL